MLAIKAEPTSPGCADAAEEKPSNLCQPLQLGTEGDKTKEPAIKKTNICFQGDAIFKCESCRGEVLFRFGDYPLAWCSMPCRLHFATLKPVVMSKDDRKFAVLTVRKNQENNFILETTDLTPKKTKFKNIYLLVPDPAPGIPLPQLAEMPPQLGGGLAGSSGANPFYLGIVLAGLLIFFGN